MRNELIAIFTATEDEYAEAATDAWVKAWG
jgi:hypothetical protein